VLISCCAASLVNKTLRETQLAEPVELSASVCSSCFRQTERGIMEEEERCWTKCRWDAALDLSENIWSGAESVSKWQLFLNYKCGVLDSLEFTGEF